MGYEKSFAFLFPELVKEWNYEKNKSVTPDNVTAFSKKKVWWKCNKGHEWEARIQNRSYGAGCPYCSGRALLKGKNDLETLYPDVAAEWNTDKNDIGPDEITAHSGEKVWWKCDKGHEWESKISNRTTLGQGCPFCAHQKMIKGENDLEYTNPELLLLWDYEQNTISPNSIGRHSHKRINWKCKKGHTWIQSLSSKVIKCPYCSNRRVLKGYNDLAYLYPEIAKEWNYEKNDKLPNEILFNSGVKVWWRCGKEHEYQGTIFDRVKRGYGCPICSGRYPDKGRNDLLTLYPELCKEWDYERNQNFPEDYLCKSGKKVWWRCKKEHRWQSTIVNRVKGNGCPYCDGKKPIIGENDLQTLFPELIREWNYEKNRVEPCEITAHSNKVVWWKCEKGHSWRAQVNNRSKGHGTCPYCSGRLPIIGVNDL